MAARSARFVLSLIAFAAACLVGTPGARADGSPDAAEMDAQRTQDAGRILQQSCATCHDVSMATSNPRPAEEWSPILERMLSYGASLTPSELETLNAYLMAHHSTTPSAGGAPTAVAPQN